MMSATCALLRGEQWLAAEQRDVLAPAAEMLVDVAEEGVGGAGGVQGLLRIVAALVAVVAGEVAGVAEQEEELDLFPGRGVLEARVRGVVPAPLLGRLHPVALFGEGFRERGGRRRARRHGVRHFLLEQVGLAAEQVHEEPLLATPDPAEDVVPGVFHDVHPTSSGVRPPGNRGSPAVPGGSTSFSRGNRPRSSTTWRSTVPRWSNRTAPL